MTQININVLSNETKATLLQDAIKSIGVLRMAQEEVGDKAFNEIPHQYWEYYSKYLAEQIYNGVIKSFTDGILALNELALILSRDLDIYNDAVMANINEQVQITQEEVDSFNL